MTVKEKSLKERAEITLISELGGNRLLKSLIPKKQNDDSRAKFPRIAVVATVGREISPQAKIFNITGAIEVQCKYPYEPADDIDAIMQAIADQMAAAQSRGTYAVTLDGEQPTQFVSDTIRKRVLQVRLIAG